MNQENVPLPYVLPAFHAQLRSEQQTSRANDSKDILLCLVDIGFCCFRRRRVVWACVATLPHVTSLRNSKCSPQHPHLTECVEHSPRAGTGRIPRRCPRQRRIVCVSDSEHARRRWSTRCITQRRQRIASAPRSPRARCHLRTSWHLRQRPRTPSAMQRRCVMPHSTWLCARHQHPTRSALRRVHASGTSTRWRPRFLASPTRSVPRSRGRVKWLGEMICCSRCVGVC